jgi:hypothetical protein
VTANSTTSSPLFLGGTTDARNIWPQRGPASREPEGPPRELRAPAGLSTQAVPDERADGAQGVPDGLAALVSTLLRLVSMTKNMRDALHAATKQPLRRLHNPQPGTPPWPAHPTTLNALTRHNYLTLTERRNKHGWRLQEWQITDAGRQALNPPPRVLRDTPRFLSRPSRTTGDYTANRHRAIDDLEAVDPAEIDAARRYMARELHADASDRRVVARRLARNARRAA